MVSSFFLKNGLKCAVNITVIHCCADILDISKSLIPQAYCTAVKSNYL